MSSSQSQDPLKDPSARTLVAGDLEAVFLPGHGMLGASLRHRSVEILRRIEDLQAAAAKGSTAGIPLLHPWANRLAGSQYRVAGREVNLDPSSRLLHLDEHGLPMHGVPWSLLAWEVTRATQDALSAQLAWTTSDLLAIFPFRHRIEITATLRPDGLVLETRLSASPDGPVPVSFGFHPYFGLPDLPRAEWRLELPAMRRLVLDPRGIPTGEEEAFDGFDAELRETSFDDCFSLFAGSPSLSVAGAGRRISVEFLSGYRYAQVFAPKGKDYVALEPMTAPTNALTSGLGLRLVEPGGEFRSAFRIRIDAL
ncbi:MAG TPA: aldose 1-epimerase [Blastocatellia bacterium]|nr:aldose 1-epimerase [Blastocatellia bacterium]